MPGHVLAVTGGKGGVGKSTTTINLGVALRMDGYSVALVDADVEMPNLMEMLGIEARYTIHDVLSGTADTTDAVVEIGDGFVAIPGDSSLSSYASIEPERLHATIDTLADAYDYVLLDTGAGLSYDDVFPLALADEIILVSSPDPAAVENAKRTQKFVERLTKQIRGVVITKGDESIDDSNADQFHTDLLGVIPDHEIVSQSTATGKPLELVAPRSPPARAYRQLEANLTDGELPPSRIDSSGEAESNSSGEPSGDDNEDPPEPQEPPTPTIDKEEIQPKRGLVGRLVNLFS